MTTMKPILKFRPSTRLAATTCVYRGIEMTLECESRAPSPRNRERGEIADSINHQFNLDKPIELLLIADTLTLTFSGVDHHLAALDAYTNRQLWKVSQLKEVPSLKGRGLLLLDPIHIKGDRVSLQATPRYEIAENQEWIRVVLDEVKSPFHYEVANNLVVGLKDESLIDIFLLNVVLM